MMYGLQICSFSILKTFAEKYFLTTTLAYLLCITAFAQVQDNFSDGNISADPTWQGTTDRFRVSTGQLRLLAPDEAGAAWLTTPSAAIANAAWEIRVAMDFNPSSNNYTRVYLTSDEADLSGSLNGYFVMIGNTDDEISLYRQTGTTRKKIIDGINGRTDTNTTTVRIRITRDIDGNWQLFSDAGVTGSYTTEGTINDTTHTRSDYFGIYCNYTATRSDKFSFDDVRVTGKAYPDNTPPVLHTINVINNTTLTLSFSEPVTQATAANVQQYTANQNLNHPQYAALLADRKTVQLIFAKSFPSKLRCTLTIAGIQDAAGNISPTAGHDFVYFNPVPARPRDIIITEIMADPTPIQGLPDAEFVEIFNRSQDPFDLTGWTLTDGTSTSTLPRYNLLPGEYAIVTEAANLFPTLPNIITVTSFPSLNNTGDKLVLHDSTDRIIDSIQYADTWYKSSSKKNGGWTLERIDPEDQCRGAENWIASEADAGGTPGKQNSVFAYNPDRTAPRIAMAIPLSPDTLLIRFSEQLDKSIPSPRDFEITPGYPTVSYIQFADDALTEIKLTIQPGFNTGTRYTITATNIRDCTGNTIDPEHNTTGFALPEKPDSLDVFINEILFNPKPTGVDFIEVINISNKFFNLRNWSIASLEDDGAIKSKKIITEQDILLEPGMYKVFTEDGNILKSEYLQAHEDTFLQTTIPAMNDDAGSIILLDAEELHIDAVSYTDQQHSPLLKDTEGVSLERIEIRLPSNDPQNWRSAASSAGFATTGYRNSNTTEAQYTDDNIIVEPEIFVPVYGTPAFTQIRYHFDRGGYIANVRIYDSQSHLIKEIARNESLSTEGSLRWDGDRDNGSKARIGQYMIWIEVFNDQGDLKTYRKRVVIAEKF